MHTNKVTKREAKVLFITQHSAYPQMGALYLSDALRQEGISSKIVSCNISSIDLEILIKQYNPAVVGVSVLTSPQVVELQKHSIFIKEKFPDIKVVWGGVHPTILTEDCLKSNYIDYVFVGQGEEDFPKLVLDIIDGRNKFSRKVKGYAARNINKYSPDWRKVDLSRYLFSEQHSVRSPIIKVKNMAVKIFNKIKKDIKDADPNLELGLSSQVLKDIKEWDVGLYELNKKIFYYLLTSRGCPYRCTFCSESLKVMHGSSDGKFFWNAHSVDWVRNQVETIRKILSEKGEELEGVGIWDDMFWYKHHSNPRALNIVNYLAGEGLTYLIEARPDQLLSDDHSLFRVLSETNCTQVFVGAESASQETLDSIRKGTKVKDYYRLMELAGTVKVTLRLSFIIGFPNESEESVNQTLDLCESITKGEFGPWVNISGPKIFTPCPGTVEYERAVSAGFQSPTSHIGWGKIHRSTEAYLEYFPWLQKYSAKTLARLDHSFGKGYSTLIKH